jgi:hypothetical protein
MRSWSGRRGLLNSLDQLITSSLGADDVEVVLRRPEFDAPLFDELRHARGKNSALEQGEDFLFVQGARIRGSRLSCVVDNDIEMGFNAGGIGSGDLELVLARLER